MRYAIATEIDKFDHLLKRAGHTYHLSQECPDTGVLMPRGWKIGGQKPIGLTLMALTHGNESAGVAVLNRVLELIIAQGVTLRIPVAFALGNTDAALAQKRFLERDLNRSFGRGGVSLLLEEKRALELESLLAQTAYLVDFHQTMQPSDRPFFIFPYRPDALHLAFAVAPWQTVVTHWGRSFSAEGLCTDEFVNDRGGLGITVELGQNGFDPYQIAVGVECAISAIAVATACLGGSSLEALSKDRQSKEPDIFTWAQIIPWPGQGLVSLDPGWTNFGSIEKDQRIGEVEGHVLRAGQSGRILFPKYLTRDQQQSATSRPAELIRIMRPVSLEELPSGSLD